VSINVSKNKNFPPADDVSKFVLAFEEALFFRLGDPIDGLVRGALQTHDCEVHMHCTCVRGCLPFRSTVRSRLLAGWPRETPKQSARREIEVGDVTKSAAAPRTRIDLRSAALAIFNGPRVLPMTLCANTALHQQKRQSAELFRP